MVKSIIGGFVVGLTIVAVSALSAIYTGFVLMLIAGAIHHDVYAQVPAYSYWQSILLAFGLSFVGGLIFKNSSTSSKS